MGNGSSNFLPMVRNFNYNQKGEVRGFEINGEVWFVAKDICDILELSDVTMSLNRLEEDERSKLNLGRQGEANIINEFGLYSLILSSRKPEAKSFKKWITHEVIPSIMKTGKYEIVKSPTNTYLDLSEEDKAIAYFEEVKRRKKEEKERLALEQKVEFDKPKVEFYDDVLNEGDDWFSCSEVAKMFVAKDRKNHSVVLGRNNLIDFLVDKKHIFKGRNGYEAYQVYVSQMIYRTNIEKVYHGVKTSVVISTKGIVKLSELLKNDGFILMANSVVKKNEREGKLI